MSKKAPDTRNKLEKVSVSNSKPKKTKVKNKFSLKDLSKTSDDKSIKQESPINIKLEKKPTKGQLFKIKYGYSKTLKRNMKRWNVTTPEEYKGIRKGRKRSQTIQRQNKHKASVTFRRLNGKKKGAKNQPKKKESASS